MFTRTLPVKISLVRGLVFGGLALGTLTLSACGDPCLDDGAGRRGDACNANDSNAGSETDSMAEADTETSAEGMEAEAGTETDTSDETPEGDTYCTDADGDGFGDPDDCETVPTGDPAPPGTVPEDMATDCDDSNPNTFPGAAENDSPDACMQDDDMDGYGDDSPSNPGVEIGSDCDDSNPDTFPGAAENEAPDACMQDEDGDGYGEQMPPEGVEPGSDCNDADNAIFMCVLWCFDNDIDGFGDPNNCVGVPPGEEPPNNTVPNNGDCVDSDPNIFPGAAENEPELCTADADDDGWGDDSITDTYPDAENGTDCDDSEANAFPGAAELDDPAACMLDADNDGWGDDMPADGIAPGRDCDDSDGNRVVCVDVTPSCTSTNLGMGTQFDVVVTGGDGNYSYLWDNADTLDDAMIPNPVATPTQITTYTIEVTDGVGNVGIDKVTVHLDDAPWVLDTDCTAVGFLGAAAPHSFANNGTTTCTTANSDPTAYVCPTVHENAQITGTMVVNPPADDDDYIGFVWGWQNSDQYYLLHWKQSQQAFGGCNSAPGITVKRVDRVQPYVAGDFTCNTDTPNTTVLLAPADTTTQGWVHGVQYGVELLYAPDQTEITITNLGNNQVVTNFVVQDSTYPSGQFGTYDYSQIRACNGPWNSSCL